MDTQQDETTWLTEQEAAARMPVCRTTLCRWRNQGFGPKHFRRGGVTRYRLRDVQQYVEQHMRGGDPPPNARHGAGGDGSDDRAA